MAEDALRGRWLRKLFLDAFQEWLLHHMIEHPFGPTHLVFEVHNAAIVARRSEQEERTPRIGNPKWNGDVLTLRDASSEGRPQGFARIPDSGSEARPRLRAGIFMIQ